MTKLLEFIKTQDWVFFLLLILVIKTLFIPASLAEGLVIAIICAFQGFKHYVFQLKLKPLDEALKKELAELKGRISRIESKDNLERLATTQSASAQQPRRYF